jgi:hypothetical protein
VRAAKLALISLVGSVRSPFHAEPTQYYFLLTYRVFTQFENYILKARTLIRGLREKGSKQRPHLDAGFREQLAQECEAYLTRIIMRALQLFPELNELSNYPVFKG